jgi:hypothetical protein
VKSEKLATAMTITIPWNDGPGNIVLTYAKGEGNQLVTVTSDTDCIDHDRQQRVTFVVGDGAIRNDVATCSGHQIRTADGNTIASLANGMKVTVMVTQLATDKRLLVTQNDHIVRTASGNIVRLPNN